MGYNIPVQDNTRLSAISIGYVNKLLIAAIICPHVMVPDRTFTYKVWNKKDGFTVPDTRISKKGVANEIEFGFTETPGMTEDHGLITKVSQDDIERGSKRGDDILGMRTDKLTEVFSLREELAVAALIQDPNNYAVGNKVTLSGTSQFSDFTNSDPVKAILKAREAMLVDPTDFTMGSIVWYYLRRHPKVIKYCFGDSAQSGDVTVEKFSEKFEFQRVNVGMARANTANIGQAPVLSRIWANHCSMTYTDMRATTTEGMTFAYNAVREIEGQERVIETKFLEKGQYGARGGTQITLVAETKPLITSNEFGYLFQNATLGDTSGD
jgi:hypothetical protein